MAIKIETKSGKPVDLPIHQIGVYPPVNAYAAHLVSKPITSTTQVEKGTKDNMQTVKSTEEVVNPGVLFKKGEAIELRVEGGLTINLGNYESARIGVSLTIPTLKADLEDAYKWAEDWIGQKLNQAKEDVKS